MAVGDTPYWCQNIPRDQWPSKCPEFLQNVSERDKMIIGTPDSEFRRLSWAEVVDVVDRDQMAEFQRLPSDLRRYRQYTHHLVEEYGSVLEFVLRERLKWASLEADGAPFANPSDMKVLHNDWPYGVDERIVHLVVWVKFELKEDPETGRLYPRARKQIDDYVNETFRPHVRPQHLTWFRNWTALKSVHAVEHFHVMLFEPDAEFVRKITNGDVPLSAKVALRPE